MKASEKCLALIKEFEGYERFPYSCPAGKLTIGYGHVIRPGETFPVKGLTESEATELLCKDLESFEARVLDLVTVPITQGQMDALCSFAYNLGAEKLKKSTLLRMLNNGFYAQAADQFGLWVNANGQKLPGLVKRRAAEKALFLGDDK